MKKNFLKMDYHLKIAKIMYHKIYKSIELKYSILFTLILVGLLLYLFFRTYPISADKINNVQSSLITASGIIAGVMIAYLSGKVFSVSSQRSTNKRELDNYSEKLTAFRRLIYYVYKSRHFWTKYDLLMQFKKNYPSIDYYLLRDHYSEDQERTKYFSEIEEKKHPANSIALYLAMEEIYKPDLTKAHPWTISESAYFNYSTDDILTYIDPCNDLWYYLEGRYEKHGKGLFNEEGIDVNIWAESINASILIIDPSKSIKDLNRKLIADFGSDFHSKTLPKFYTLTEANTGIPKRTLTMTHCLTIIIIFGVIMPLLSQGVKINSDFIAEITSIFISITILAIIYFIHEFYQLLEEETDIFKK